MGKFRQLGLGAKLSGIAFILITLVIGILIGISSYTTSSLQEKQALDDLTEKSQSVVQMIDLFNATLKNEAERSLKTLEAYFPGKFTQDGNSLINVAGKSVPVLKSGGSTINNDHSVVDRFSAQSGIQATVFVRHNNDFVRISTSLKNNKGERVVGTALNTNGAAYKNLMDGKTYNGIATLFGRQYFTEYLPLKNGSGQVIGALYIGIDFTETVKLIKNRIISMKVGDSGFFYAIDAAPGNAYGNIVMHQKDEGKNVLDIKATDGREIVKELLKAKNGVMHYFDAADPDGRERIISFHHFKDWDWIVIGRAYTDEITRDARTLRNWFMLGGLLAVVALAILLYLLVRNLVSQPLAHAVSAAGKIAKGDLTVRLESDRTDEIGQLTNAMNSISQGLANVVWNVRRGTDTIASASTEIASGNQDLSSRTEQQASSLEETASSMEELTSTVRQNAENAMQANQLAVTASDVATRGGNVVSQVVETMHAIDASSKKIADIINVIDGIAFQTNILALNAAVEAARAGEQGRGFAVVATEVRSLAQRSATAAREIKELIDDSVGKVEAGSKLVEHAGTTMQEVVTSIRQVHDIMVEITEASREQSDGIEQVNQAITQMDQVTQQNAALVEQAAAAAEALQNQSADLVKQVSLFKLKSTSTGTKDEAAALVKKAIEQIKEQGRDAAFTEISNPLGRFTDRDLYVVVYDLSGKNLAHGANPKLIGQNLIDSKDGDGKPYVRERIDIIRNHGKGWQDYTFLNPVSKNMEPKSMYLEQHEDLIVGCGIYKT
ncbi:MAG: putative Methyl-accepting chemotaxis protein [Burkholderiaceae bacterium]|nr:putative Methyl-accepting chemotaxis protein [Burkholderiaceae bacterium]